MWQSVSDLVRDVKANSSHWIHESQTSLRGFAWQSGYGAFSVSESSVTSVIAYIANQEEHHRTKSFKDEFIQFLRRHRVQYDERFLWD